MNFKALLLCIFIPYPVMAVDVVVYEREDGGVTVLCPAGGFNAGQVRAKDMPPGRPFKIVPHENVPTNRGTRNGWTFSPGRENGIVVP